MKAKKNIFMAIFLSCLGLTFSCSNEDYSCDPMINKWVGENIDDIHLMTRSEWIHVDDISKQRGAYGAFSVKQKVDLWIGKFDEVLKLDWTLEEQIHIEKVAHAIQSNPGWFDQNSEDRIHDEKALFIQAWLDYAVEVLKWKDELIYALVFTPERIGEDKIVIQSAISLQGVKTRSEIIHNCDCHNPESAHYFQCGHETRNCIKGNCEETSWKCGWMWTDLCNGLCYSR